MKSKDNKITETEKEIIVDGDLILEKDFTTDKNLIVRGNISGKYGTRWNINARNINARNINALDINALDINALDINALDINARNINALDINALDINALDIICETRKKKSETCKTKARIYIKNKSKIEWKEHANPKEHNKHCKRESKYFKECSEYYKK